MIHPLKYAYFDRFPFIVFKPELDKKGSIICNRKAYHEFFNNLTFKHATPQGWFRNVKLLFFCI